MLKPAKAQVIDVNTNRPLTLPTSLAVPPRSSSITRTGSSDTLDRGRKSRLNFRDARSITPDYFACFPREREFDRHSRASNSPQPFSRTGIDLAMSSPPISPTSRIVNKMFATQGWASTKPQSNDRDELIWCPRSRRDSVCKIILNLEESIRDFPATTLLSDSQCVSSMRAYQQQLRPLVSYHSQTGLANSMSQLTDEVDWRPPCDLDYSSATVATNTARVHRKRCSSTSNTECRLTHQSQSQSQRPSTSCNTFDASLKHPQSNPLAAPKLQPIRNIFPRASEWVIGAVYAHIVAYNFLNSVSLSSDSPHNIPFHTWTSQELPSKAAKTLGIPAMNRLPRISNTREDVLNARDSTIEAITDAVLRCIEYLLHDVDGAGFSRSDGLNGGSLEATLVRALVEVVKGCE